MNGVSSFCMSIKLDKTDEARASSAQRHAEINSLSKKQELTYSLKFILQQIFYGVVVFRSTILAAAV